MPSAQPTTFCRNPIGFILDRYRQRQDEKLAKDALTQEKYFDRMIRWIGNTRYSLLICGYDRPFMELPQVQDGLAKAARGYQRMDNIIISAIIPEGTKAGILEELANETDSVSINRTREHLSRGYLVHDLWGVNLWDSNKVTGHPQEKEKGVIWRYARIDDLLAARMAYEFHESMKGIHR